MKNPFQRHVDDAVVHAPYHYLPEFMRQMDAQHANGYLEALFSAVGRVFSDTLDSISNVWQFGDAAAAPDKCIQYAKDHVGFDGAYDWLTSQYDVAGLRRLMYVGIQYFRQRYAAGSILNFIKYVFKSDVHYKDWFAWRFILGEAYLEEHNTHDAWILSENSENIAVLYVEIGGELNRETLLNMLGDQRAIDRRFEVILCHFLDGSMTNRSKWSPYAQRDIHGNMVFLSGVEYEPQLQEQIDKPWQLYVDWRSDGPIDWSIVLDASGDKYLRLDVTSSSATLVYYDGTSETTIGASPVSYDSGVWYTLRIVDIVYGADQRLMVYSDGSMIIDEHSQWMVAQGSGFSMQPNHTMYASIVAAQSVPAPMSIVSATVDSNDAYMS